MFFSKCVWIMKRQPIPVGEVFEDHSVSAVMIIKQVTVYNPRSANIKIWSSHSFGSWIHIYRIEAPSCLASFSFPAPRICPRSSHPSMAYIPCFVCIIQSIPRFFHPIVQMSYIMWPAADSFPLALRMSSGTQFPFYRHQNYDCAEWHTACQQPVSAGRKQWTSKPAFYMSFEQM